ncbi:DUF6533 domain-containing protein [Pleurotus pulmonarius]
MPGSSADADNYFACMQDKQMSTYFLYAATTLYFYDFGLTFATELRYIWQRRKPSLRNVLYFIARYCGFASAIAGAFPPTLTMGNVVTGFRLITIIASDVVLAQRAWVLWKHSKIVKSILISAYLGALGPCLFVVYEDIKSAAVATSTRAIPGLTTDDVCSFLVSDATSLWIIPYIMSIFFELVTFILASFAAVLWRKRIPTPVRSSLVSVLWKDGAMYFGFMAGFSIFNILLVMSIPRPQLRNGGSQLQTLLHSIISSRVVLHLASVLDTSGHPSLTVPRTNLRFAPNHSTVEDSTRSSPPSRESNKGYDKGPTSVLFTFYELHLALVPRKLVGFGIRILALIDSSLSTNQGGHLPSD